MERRNVDTVAAGSAVRTTASTTQPELASVLADIWMHRYALRNLVLKDFRLRYRNMSLGVVWSILNPLVMLVILLVIFTYVFPQKGEPYLPISILIGLVAYNLPSLCIPAATSAVLENASLVKKVVFPRHILPISVVLSQAIQVLVQFSLVAVFLVIFRTPVTAKLLLAPVIVGVMLLFVIGAGFVSSALFVIFRDVRYIVESLLTILFWLSPVFYSLTTVHQSFPRWLFAIYILNPFAGCIEGLRRVILKDAYPDGISFAIAVAVSAGTFVAGFLLFNALQRRFADLV